LFRHYSVIFDSVKVPFADTRVLNEPKNVRKVFPLFENIHHCSRSSDCLSKQRERVVYANCTISLYQAVSLASPPLPSPSSLHPKQFQLDMLLLLYVNDTVVTTSRSLFRVFSRNKDDITIIWRTMTAWPSWSPEIITVRRARAHIFAVWLLLRPIVYGKFNKSVLRKIHKYV